MFKSHEGEIVFKEKYGSAQEIYYVKPPDQNNVVVLHEEKYINVGSWFMSIFLPQGYPESVSKDYLAYQKWDTAQAFCSTITGTLATQEVLRGVGVGDTSATPLAATVTWVIKDGCGHLGKILFAFSHGTSLDAYSKKWRLYADTLNDAAMCIEIALPLFKNYTTFALCVSTVMKAIVGVAGGATRAAMTQHHAVRGNMADVAAKDSAQETAVNLVASFTALLIISLFGNHLVIFLLMMVLHIVFNYFAVRAVCLRTLNEPRFLQVIDTYLRKEMIAAPCEVNRKEPIIFYQIGPNVLDLKLCGFQIKLGCSLKDFAKDMPSASYLKKLRKIYDERNYVLNPMAWNRNMHIFIKENATSDDMLCAYFHAVLLAVLTCAINDEIMPLYQGAMERPFAQVCRAVQAAEWSREPVKNAYGPCPGYNYEPSYELMRYVEKIVQNEWYRVRLGLEHTGWDLSKNLLIVDEWRICNTVLEPSPIPMETTEVGANVSQFGLSQLAVPDDEMNKKTFLIEPDD